MRNHVELDPRAITWDALLRCNSAQAHILSSMQFHQRNTCCKYGT